MPRPQKPSGGYMVKGGGGMKKPRGGTPDYDNTQVNPNFGKQGEFKYEDIDTESPYLDTRGHWLGIDALPKFGHNNAADLNNQIGYGVVNQRAMMPVALEQAQGLDDINWAGRLANNPTLLQQSNDAALNLEKSRFNQSLANTDTVNSRYAQNVVLPTLGSRMQLGSIPQEIAGNPAAIGQWAQNYTDISRNQSLDAGNIASRLANENEQARQRAISPYAGTTAGNDAEANMLHSGLNLSMLKDPSYIDMLKGGMFANADMPMLNAQKTAQVQASPGEMVVRPPASFGPINKSGLTATGMSQQHTAEPIMIDGKPSQYTKEVTRTIPGSIKTIPNVAQGKTAYIVPPASSLSPILGGAGATALTSMMGGNPLDTMTDGRNAAFSAKTPEEQKAVTKNTSDEDNEAIIPKAASRLKNSIYDMAQRNFPLDNDTSLESKAQEPSAYSDLLRLLMGSGNEWYKAASKPNTIKHKALPMPSKKK
jgi:hypothetical protein